MVMESDDRFILYDCCNDFVNLNSAASLTKTLQDIYNDEEGRKYSEKVHMYKDEKCFLIKEGFLFLNKNDNINEVTIEPADRMIELIYGKDAMEKIAKAHVAVFGVGGVGEYVIEALARSGVSHFSLVDDDKVALSNINRQIIATMDTIGKYKVDVMKDRILSINPNAIVEVHKCFFLPTNQDDFDFTKYDYVVDAIDTVTAKIALVLKAQEANVPIISSMGTGNKVNPMGFIVSDISKTEM